MAAHQGHAPAMYALGLMHLDGSEMYYSCELALKLFRSAAERGEWADKSKEVSILFPISIVFIGLQLSQA